MKWKVKTIGTLCAMFMVIFSAYFAVPVHGAELEELPANAIAIGTPEELNMICNEYPADGYYYLACDIDLTEILSEFGDMYNEGKGWEPIGTSSVPFSGTFDGRGNKITGLIINRTTSYNGFFGYAKNAVIKNLIIQEGNVTGKAYTAMLLGKGVNTILTDCTIEGGNVLSSGSYVAGIVGVLTEETSVSLYQCSNSASVTGSKYVAGCVAFASGTDYIIEKCYNSGNVISEDGGYFGGITADANTGTILRSVNNGLVESVQVQSFVAGGIAGRAATIKECINNGDASGVLWYKHSWDDFPKPNRSYIGGIGGIATLIEGCVNRGDIDGAGGGAYNSTIYPDYAPAFTGGIGADVKTISNSYNSGIVSNSGSAIHYYAHGAIIGMYDGAGRTVKNCYSVNTDVPLVRIESGSATVVNCYSVGGLIALENATATNCYYYAESESGVGELRTKRQLRIKSTFTDWDFENVWTMEGNEDYLYPELIGMEPDYKKSVVSISLSALPEKTNYLEGRETLDLTGAEIRVTYDNEMTEKIPVTEEMVSGFDNTVIGKKTIKVTYEGQELTFDVTIIAKSLESIEVTTLPQKLEYLEAKDSLDVTGGIITLYYNNDTTATKTLTNSMVSGFDNTVVGSQALTVTYSGKTTTYDVEIIGKSLEKIEVTKLPTKTTYLEVKDSLDLAGGQLTLYYDNGQTETIDLSEAEVTGFNNQEIGVQTLNVRYGEVSTGFQVEVEAKSISGIVLAVLPEKLSYLENKDELDVSDGRIRIIYNNDTEDMMDLTEDMVSGFDNTDVGNQTLTVSYAGKTTTYQIEIIAKSLIGIVWKEKPAKLIYKEYKDVLDVTNGSITLVYDNDTTADVDITTDMVSGFDNTVVGVQMLTVSYADYTLTYVVEILQKNLTSIEITTLPDKLTYLEAKDDLDLSGGRLTLYYDNNQTETLDLSEAAVTGFDNEKVGTQTLTVCYGNASTEFRINIKAKSVSSIIWAAEPKKLSYLEGKDELDVSGGRIRITYNNDTDETVDLTKEMVSGFDNTVIGSQTLTVNYAGGVLTYEVEVIAKSLIGIVWKDKPAKLTYKEYKDTLNVTGGRISLVYDNDTTIDVNLTKSMVTGFDNTVVGVQTLTVSYAGYQLTYDVEILQKSLSSIGVTTLPKKLTYLELKDDLDTTDGKVTLYYDNATKEIINLTQDMVYGFDNTTPGLQSLTVIYNGKQTTYKVEIIAKELVSVTVKTMPDKLIYEEGETLNLAGGEILLTYNNGQKISIPMKDAEISDFDSSKGGTKILTVSYDGKNTEIEIQVLHSYSETVTEPTCSAPGYTTHTCACGDSYVDTEVEAIGHAYETVVTNPDCENAGYSTHTCENCGDIYVDAEVEALGHDMGNWEVLKEADCEESGEQKRDCSRCDYDETEEIPETGHAYETVVTNPDCENAGYSTHTCGNCGDIYVDAEVEALGHDMGNWEVLKEADCEESGEQKRDCSRCDYDETEEIPETGHAYETVVTNPDCENAGYSTHTCGNCGDIYVDAEVEALGHDMSDWIITKEADCEKLGAMARACKRCEHSESTRIPALGHAYNTVVTEPTCEEGGYSTHICQVCEDWYVDDETESLGHSFTNYISDNNATVDSMGTKTAKCDRCDETDTIPDPTVGVPVVPETSDVSRIFGATRYETSYKIANMLKVRLDIEKFDAIVIATGKNFADALAGSYLAIKENAPILLTNGKTDNILQLHEYISENVKEGGKVYILGGDGAVPTAAEDIDGYDVCRLSGATRYETNIAILNEAGISGDQIIIATGKSFADSLSASAAKLPILLVKPGATLNEDQKAIVKNMNDIYIIGGDGAIGAKIAAELSNYGDITRVSGNTRYETSVAVAKTFFEDAEEVIIASGKNFPDGLCGGPLAAAIDAPLILTTDGKTEAARDYVQEEEIAKGYVLGGTSALGDAAVIDIFGLRSED